MNRDIRLELCFIPAFFLFFSRLGNAVFPHLNEIN